MRASVCTGQFRRDTKRAQKRDRGHATLAVTAIYADAWGVEERNIAARMWA